jgi:predicted naringenin-chalcone synthase
VKSKITCVETANPSLRKDQKELIELMRFQDYSERSKKFYNRFLSDDGVRSRTFALDSMEVLATENCDESVLRFEKMATELAVRAGRKCLESAGLAPQQIDGLIITTCTGYLCPGLTSHVGEVLGISPDIFILDVVGHGCGAAVPGLRIADQFLLTKKDANVLFIAVEVSSATFVHGEAIDLILSNSIFGDGAAACIVTNCEKSGWLLERHGCLLVPEHREQLRFKTVNSRLNNVLGKDVPQIVARGVKELLSRMQITQLPDTLVFHPGGRLILDTLQQELNINPASLMASRYVLSEYGNMSSPCVLFILKRWMDTTKFADGTPALMVSYGAGVSVNAACLRWSEQERVL